MCPLFLFSPPLTDLLEALREREGCCDGVTPGGKWAATSVMMTDAEAPVTIAKKGRQSCSTLFHRKGYWRLEHHFIRSFNPVGLTARFAHLDTESMLALDTCAGVAKEQLIHGILKKMK